MNTYQIFLYFKKSGEWKIKFDLIYESNIFFNDSRVFLRSHKGKDTFCVCMCVCGFFRTR